MRVWNDFKDRCTRSCKSAALAMVCGICADYTDSKVWAVFAGMMVALFLQEFFGGWDDARRKRRV